ncbi:hypothetical protein [Sphaerisporangium rubeum]|uniref:Uncharacterized protein n=1 Tax=Sphaerisporangium rubeum TaxID=321317 RepID=A0A7X0IFK5_9ACTN|nr:hypothetical protein [Sphaerisporangium rubeum]MBB6474311.1 hypothetical protein [Sphaerisporangium rubeum]
MAARPQLVDRFVVGVDVSGYSSRTTRRQLEVQQDLDEILTAAAERSGMDRSRWVRQMSGDGELAELPEGTDPVAVVGRWVAELDELLRDHNDGHAPGNAIRLRVAMHTDVLARSSLGAAGPALVVVSRLLDSAPVRAALAAAPNASLALIVSDAVYRKVVLSEFGGLRPAAFREAGVDLPGKGFHELAYIHVPGFPLAGDRGDPPGGTTAAPGGPSPYDGRPSGGPGGPAAPPPQAAAGPAAPPSWDAAGRAAPPSRDAGGPAALFSVGAQYGETFYQAQTIQIHAPAERPDPFGLGLSALRARRYAAARRRMAEARELDPGDPRVCYYLALAMLGGHRPHLHHRASVEEITSLLDGARDRLPEAGALWCLVLEDHRMSWTPHTAVPPELVRLVDTVPPDRAAEITGQFTAEENQVWRLLAARAERSAG